MNCMDQVVTILVAGAVAGSYVAGIHAFKPSYLIGKDRNDPEVMKYRFRNVSLLTVGWVIGTPFLVSTLQKGGKSPFQVLMEFRLLPLSWYDLYQCAYSFILVSVLYVGPIFNYVISPPTPGGGAWQDLIDSFCNIYGFRDHIFAPVTEEVIYRAVIDTIMIGQFSPGTVFYTSPLFFGIAHIHHGYDLIVHKRMDPRQVSLTVLFQTAYTTLFGIMANAFYMNRHTLWGAIIVHSMCNLMGFPEACHATSSLYRKLYYCLLVLGPVVFLSFISERGE